MDHIRSAIDKARKERSVKRAQNTQGAGPSEALRDSALETLDTIWKVLPEVTMDPKHLSRNRVMTYQANPAATPFDVMRTNLLHEMRSKKWRRVAITSPGSKCGKTTICMNLAFSLARQRDLRVMVVELDLRRPSMARILDLPDAPEFAAALAGQANADDNIRRVGNNLAFAVSRHAAKSPAELLQGVTAAHVIDALEARYKPDVMIFDMPPMLVADDTMAFIDQIDAALLIGAAESTTMNEMSRCKQDLEDRTNLIGVVLNKCRYLDSAEGFAYGSY